MIHPGAQIRVHAPTVAAVTVIKHEKSDAAVASERGHGNGSGRGIRGKRGEERDRDSGILRKMCGGRKFDELC